MSTTQGVRPELRPGPSLAAGLLVLLFIVLARSARRRAAGGIRLAPPAFVPLPADAASRLARDLGTAYAAWLATELRDAEAEDG